MKKEADEEEGVERSGDGFGSGFTSNKQPVRGKTMVRFGSTDVNRQRDRQTVAVGHAVRHADRR